MTSEGEQSVNKSPPRAMMPSYLVLRDFLAGETAAGLLDFALAHEADFEPAKTGRLQEGKINPHPRLGGDPRSRAVQAHPQVADAGARARPVAKLGAAPVEAPRLELELVAHNDGAFFKRHIDTQTASDRQNIRVLSGVYYFHAAPKAFSGGALRLYAIGGPTRRITSTSNRHTTACSYSTRGCRTK